MMIVDPAAVIMPETPQESQAAFKTGDCQSQSPVTEARNLNTFAVRLTCANITAEVL
jgi:hypothetical protein